MSSAIPIPTEQGYSPPSVRQFAVFLDNKVGKLLELLKLFEDDSMVNVAALSVMDSSDHAVVRMIFSNADAARHLLRKNNYTFSELDLIVVQICQGQSLTKLCLHLLGAELNIRFVYPVLMRAASEPCVALAVDDTYLAGQILLRKRFTLLGEEDLS
ncbi:MAG: acetolactate synthase [Planctomycetota bacterium]|nr:acetolactate synthase [Planctomycetota bacterium]MDA1262119.1 acetolactate synthase [Planctomycetota bacterium]